jgi:hypothetical protein
LPDITLQVPQLVTITMSAGSQKSAESTEDLEDTSQESCSQMFSFAGDGGLDVKRKYEEDMIELEEYRKAERKRKKRKQKQSEKGSSFKRLSLIPVEGKLSEDRTYLIGKMTRQILWRNVKYFSEIYRNDCLRQTLPKLGLNTEQDRETFSDHVIFYIDQKLTTCRNNAIYVLKKMFFEDKKGGM